jgi:hypothetical protein
MCAEVCQLQQKTRIFNNIPQFIDINIPWGNRIKPIPAKIYDNQSSLLPEHPRYPPLVRNAG